MFFLWPILPWCSKSEAAFSKEKLVYSHKLEPVYFRDNAITF